MTSWVSYVGDLSDPDFYWRNPGDQPRAGNLPRRIAPVETLANLGLSVFWAMAQIEAGHDGKKLDWGAWGLKMTGAEIQALLADRTDKAAYVADLEPTTTYVFVVAETA